MATNNNEAAASGPRDYLIEDEARRVTASLQQQLAAEKERAERAEGQRDGALNAAANTLANINDTCRSRGFTAGPSGTSTEDRVIAMAQAYDAANARIAELERERAGLAERIRGLAVTRSDMPTYKKAFNAALEAAAQLAEPKGGGE